MSGEANSFYFSFMPTKSKVIKSLRYADDTTLMAESEEELKSML